MYAKSWTKSPEEIEKIQKRLRNQIYRDVRWLSVEYLSRLEIVRQILPPPLEPLAEPIVTVGIGLIGGSNCCGKFDGGSLSIAARYRDIEGEYCLAMPMTTDVAIILGREIYGEPKKQAHVQLSIEGDVVRASVERFGVTYMSLEAHLTEDLPRDKPTVSDQFHFKFMPAAEGHGLEFDPVLIQAHYTSRLSVRRGGQGKVTFRPSHHDPVSEIEIVEVRGAVYSVGELRAELHRLTTVAADRFMPYAFQNIDDYTAFD